MYFGPGQTLERDYTHLVDLEKLDLGSLINSTRGGPFGTTFLKMKKNLFTFFVLCCLKNPYHFFRIKAKFYVLGLIRKLRIRRIELCIALIVNSYSLRHNFLVCYFDFSLSC